MRQRQYRSKHRPYRLLCELLWGQFTWLKWEDPQTFYLKTGPMARKLRVPRERVREYFEYLQRHRFVSKLEYGQGWVRARVNSPKHWEKYFLTTD